MECNNKNIVLKNHLFLPFKIEEPTNATNALSTVYVNKKRNFQIIKRI